MCNRAASDLRVRSLTSFVFCAFAEGEHGYASSHVPAAYDLLQTSSKKSKLRKSQAGGSSSSSSSRYGRINSFTHGSITALI